MIGVAGLMRAYRAGNVTITNAVGTGIADDKAIYTYVPEIIDFYLGEKAILKNVPTWRCREPERLALCAGASRRTCREGSQRFGRLWHARRSACNKSPDRDFRRTSSLRIRTISSPSRLSRCRRRPTLCDAGIAPRHVDLRPFVLTGANGMRVVPGGLTRVALKEKSLVVNSSQGGGTKDTWIVEDSIFDEVQPLQSQTQMIMNRAPGLCLIAASCE